MSSADNTKYILKTRWLQKINVTNNNNANNKNTKKEDDKIGLRTKPEGATSIHWVGYKNISCITLS